MKNISKYYGNVCISMSKHFVTSLYIIIAHVYSCLASLSLICIMYARKIDGRDDEYPGPVAVTVRQKRMERNSIKGNCVPVC